MRITRASKYTSGQKAPSFHAVTHADEVITNDSLLGSKYILFFYNHDGSETCTKEACNLRDNFELLTKLGYLVFGVSEDSRRKHTKFIQKYALPFSLIVDEDNKLASAFDIYGPKEFMGRTSDAVHRTTFVVDKVGIIEAVIHPVDSARHAQQIIEALKANEDK